MLEAFPNKPKGMHWQTYASVSTARVAYDASGLGSCDSCHRLFFE